MKLIHLQVSVYKLLCSKRSFLLRIFILLSLSITAQQKIIPLYNGAAPGSESWNWDEKEIFMKVPFNARIVYNVVKPTLTVFTPDSANGTAVIIFPGGALRILPIETEGSFVAKELIKKGITVFLLKYRLVHTITDDPFQEALNSLKDTSKQKQDNNALVGQMAKEDAATAMKYVKQHAAEYKIDERKIGVLGFSAGGSMAINLSISEKPEMRPGFVGLIYSVYRGNTIPTNAPPAFIAAATDDTKAPSTNSTNLYNTWVASKNSAELHIYSRGEHGLRGSTTSEAWIVRFEEWLVTQGFLKSIH